MQSLLRPAWDSLALMTCGGSGPGRFGAIFFLHGWGDLILGARCVEALSEWLRGQGLRSRLFVNAQLVEFAQENLRVDDVFGVDWRLFERSLGYRFQLIRELAREGDYAVAIQPTLNRRLAVEDSLMRATRAPVRIGSYGAPRFIESYERPLGDRFYTRLVPTPVEPVHDLESYREFCNFLDIKVEATPWNLKGPPGKLVGPYLAILPQSSDTTRQWGMERFLEVALRVARPRGWEVILLGEGGGEPVAGVRDLRGQTTHSDLTGFLAHARLILCNDSGPFHVGVALGRPTVAVGGSGMPTRYFPYPTGPQHARVVFREVPCAGCGWICRFTARREAQAWCIEQVSVDEVYRAVEERLMQQSRGSRLRGEREARSLDHGS